MRVLHVEKFVQRRRGGASAYMFDVVARQRERGREVAIFGMDHPDNEPTAFASRFAPRVDLDPPPAQLAAKITTAAQMVWSRQAAAAMDGVLTEFRPDIVHCHNIYHQLSPSILRPVAKRNIPTVMTVHDFKLVCPTYHLRDNQGADCTACVGSSPLHVVRKRCEGGSLTASGVLAIEALLHRAANSYRTVDRFLCPSTYMLQQLRSGGIAGDRLVHLPNAVELPTIDLTEPNESNPTTKLVFTGQLIERKGVDLLLEAIETLPDVGLTVCGDGPQRAELERRARPMADRVRFLGHLGAEPLHEQLCAADALVLPSRGMENQPLSVLEGFARGLPAIVADTAPMRELVADGKNGLTFQTGSVAGLRAAIETVTADPVSRSAMAAEARMFAENHHDIEHHLDHIEAVYNDVMHGGVQP